MIFFNTFKTLFNVVCCYVLRVSKKCEGFLASLFPIDTGKKCLRNEKRDVFVASTYINREVIWEYIVYNGTHLSGPRPFIEFNRTTQTSLFLSSTALVSILRSTLCFKIKYTKKENQLKKRKRMSTAIVEADVRVTAVHMEGLVRNKSVVVHHLLLLSR
jgi:hypothetical protein